MDRNHDEAAYIFARCVMVSIVGPMMPQGPLKVQLSVKEMMNDRHVNEITSGSAGLRRKHAMMLSISIDEFSISFRSNQPRRLQSQADVRLKMASFSAALLRARIGASEIRQKTALQRRTVTPSRAYCHMLVI